MKTELPKWLVLSLLLAFPLSAQQPPSPVRVGSVVSQEVQQQQEVTGNLGSPHRSRVASRESGPLVSVRVREGDRVRKGAVLATIDGERLELEKRHTEIEAGKFKAIADKHRTALEHARKRLARRDESVRLAPGSVSREELEQARHNVSVMQADLKTAEGDVRMAAERLALLAVRLRDLEVRAPFDGIVVARHAEAGEWIQPGSPVVSMVSTGRLEARFEVPERVSIAALREAGRLSVRMGDRDVVLESSEIRVVPDVDPRSRRFTLIVTVDPGKHELTPGMTARVTIPVRQRAEHKLVPADAVMRDAGGRFVYKVTPGQGGSVAVPVQVSVLFEHGGKAAVESVDLKAGDNVVIEGNERLRPMTPVRVVEEAPR